MRDVQIKMYPSDSADSSNTKCLVKMWPNGKRANHLGEQFGDM